MLRETYLKEHRRGTYTTLQIDGELREHLYQTDLRANEMLESLMADMTKTAGVTEELKRSDPLTWVGLMNNLKASAEEIIFRELIYI